MLNSVIKTALSLAALAAILEFLQGTPAWALNNKSYVSNTGSDANNCSSIPLACGTFGRAMLQTAAGGEISVVNTGEYDSVLITQSVSITNDGAGEAGILIDRLGPGLGIHINAGAGDIVGLRGLVIDGQGTGARGGDTGVLIERVSAVHIQNCVIRNFEGEGTGWGIVHLANGQLFVSDTLIYNNGSSGGTGGILLQPSGTISSRVVLDRVHLENNVVGLWVDGRLSNGNGSRALIRDSVVSGNASDGIIAISTPGQAPAFIVVEHTTSANNGGIGIHADGPHAVIVVNDDTITQNSRGMSALNGGQLISFGNNKNFNNFGPEGAPTGFYSQM